MLRVNTVTTFVFMCTKGEYFDMMFQIVVDPVII